MEKVTDCGVPLLYNCDLIQVDKSNTSKVLEALSTEGVPAKVYDMPVKAYLTDTFERMIQHHHNDNMTEQEAINLQEVAACHSYKIVNQMEEDRSIAPDASLCQLAEDLQPILKQYGEKNFSNIDKKAVGFDSWFK